MLRSPVVLLPRGCALVAFALLTLLGRRAACAADLPLPTLATPAVVRVGELVELRWTELPAAIEELEVTLSLDDGGSWHRISPELDGRARSFQWRVPDLPATAARLRLRVGTDREEFETQASASFRILGSTRPGRERARYRGSPWWSGLESHGEPLANRFASSDAQLAPLTVSLEAVTPTRIVVEDSCLEGAPLLERSTRAPEPGTPDSARPASRFFPLRN